VYDTSIQWDMSIYFEFECKVNSETSKHELNKRRH